MKNTVKIALVSSAAALAVAAGVSTVSIAGDIDTNAPIVGSQEDALIKRSNNRENEVLRGAGQEVVEEEQEATISGSQEDAPLKRSNGRENEVLRGAGQENEEEQDAPALSGSQEDAPLKRSNREN